MASKEPPASLMVEGHELQITNPNKLLWPEAGITKTDYIREMIRLSPYLLAACRDRFLTTIRYPHGVQGEFFYQKNVPPAAPSFVETAMSGDIRYIVLQNVPTLLWLANLACIEFHPSLHRIGDPLPAEWIIDLDPSVREEERIMEAAWIVGEAMERIGIRTIPKTSGATGVQLIVPIKRGPTFMQLRELGEMLAVYLCELHPQLFTIERLKKNRGTRIYIDYMQHDASRTIAAPYTPRATPYASVSMPLTWDEVRRNPKPRDYHLLNAAERLAQVGDLIREAEPQAIEPILEAFSSQIQASRARRS